MFKKLDVPTRFTKEYISKYLNKNIELQAPPKPKKKHNPYFPNILCKFYAKNACFKGEECIFSHDPTQFQCMNEKDCDKSTCNFKHDENMLKCNQAECSNENKPVFMSPFDN